MNDTTTTTVSSSSAVASLTDLDTICEVAETRYHSGERVTVLGLSKQFGQTPNEIRKALIDKYSNRVTFVRGRTGGVRIA